MCTKAECVEMLPPSPKYEITLVLNPRSTLSKTNKKVNPIILGIPRATLLNVLFQTTTCALKKIRTH